ncbi:hypothetical protein FALBO_16820 [Fusarium albosuccineum]|uniref:Uncharacterized protein n=1 Tax=Fusarium albosuccineum TaxID=1237068 RepID=A0A8H4KDZ2_9HYPO|nr:hypothetical protein FALBO_16820 [Fusarium albosuccineum]
MAKRDARPKPSQSRPSEASDAASEPDDREWPDNFDASSRRIRYAERIQAVVGQMPWVWLSEFPPKH